MKPGFATYKLWGFNQVISLKHIYFTWLTYFILLLWGPNETILLELLCINIVAFPFSYLSPMPRGPVLPFTHSLGGPIYSQGSTSPSPTQTFLLSSICLTKCLQYFSILLTTSYLTHQKSSLYFFASSKHLLLSYIPSPLTPRRRVAHGEVRGDLRWVAGCEISWKKFGMSKKTTQHPQGGSHQL